jgi:Concanavalin A-like lectin/glucanases superfamily
VKSRFVRLLLGIFVLTVGLWGYSVPAQASVTSSPTFELDASNPSSLATSGATSWRDVVSGGTIAGTLVGTAAYSSDSGGVLTLTGSGNNGAYFPASASGTPTNPSGDMSLFLWVKFSSLRAGWNILSTRWFTDRAGNEIRDWHFAVFMTGSTPVLNLYTNNKNDMNGVTPLAINTWYQVGFTLTWAGNLQFYINGAPDGPVITGATRSASASPQFWVGDARTSGEYSMLGSMARVRMWNSKLESTTVLNDFNNERATFGYAPLVSSASFTLASNTPTYRALNTITATVPLNSKVTFYENKRVIPGCKNVASVSTTAFCRWKPSSHGEITVRVSYTTSGSATVNWAPTASVLAGLRSSKR